MNVFFSIFIGIRIDLLSLRLGDGFRCRVNSQVNRLINTFSNDRRKLNAKGMARMQVKLKRDRLRVGK
jgi:hypothetical protein